MTLFVLDTDHVTLAQRGHPQVTHRIRSTPFGELTTTIVTIQEQMQGRLAQIQGANSQDALIEAYFHLHQTVRFHRKIQTLDFDDAASRIFLRLRSLRVRISTHDLRIASIALANHATMVTRNARDFQRVSGLIIEDWTQ